MSETTEFIKTVAPIAAPFVTAIVETFVKPKLQKLSKFLKKEEASGIISLEAKFQEYLERSYEHHSYVNVLAFQNQQKRLSDIYIPLTVVNENTKATFLLDEYKRGFIPKYKKVLVSDTAGMGKSTLMRRLFLFCIEENKGIPIFIEMRKLKGEVSIFNYIVNELNPIDDEFDEDFIRRLIKEGNFIFFFDGYDEIPLSQRDAVVSNLNDFISKAGNNLFIITSRPESSLASFPDFMNFNIQPLKLEQSFELLKKYDNSGEISAEIISKLEGDTLKSIKEFLTSPLLVSLLFKSYEYKRKIPLKKHLFYRQVFDSLYESHDLTKNPPLIRPKFSSLEIDDFHRVLRVLGFITMKLGEIEYDKDSLLSLIKQAKERCVGLDFKESDFLKDLLSTVPIFNRDGGYYTWSHKSLQDYFAAQFIWHDSGENKTDILRKIVRSDDKEKYLNVLDLYYDIDYKTFRQTIIYEMLSDYLIHLESAYPYIDKQSSTEKEIQDLRIMTFGKIIFSFPRETGTEKCSKFASAKDTIQQLNEILDYQLTEISEEDYTGYLGVYDKDDAFEMHGNFNHFVARFLYNKKLNLFFGIKDYEELSAWNQNRPRLKDFFIAMNEGSYRNTIKEIGLASVNKLLATFAVDNEDEFLLHPDKCKKMKEEIEAEIEREESSDLFDKF